MHPQINLNLYHLLEAIEPQLLSIKDIAKITVIPLLHHYKEIKILN